MATSFDSLSTEKLQALYLETLKGPKKGQKYHDDNDDNNDGDNERKGDRFPSTSDRSLRREVQDLRKVVRRLHHAVNPPKPKEKPKTWLERHGLA